MATPPTRVRLTTGANNNEALAYGMESMLVELATDPFLASLKPTELKPELMPVLAGMLLGYAVRARALHKDILLAVQGAKAAAVAAAKDKG